MTTVFELETQLQAAVRDIELLRNDIRSAFDGLDTQAKALASVNTRIDSLDRSVTDRVNARTEHWVTMERQIDAAREEAAVRRATLGRGKQPTPQDYRRAYGVAGAETAAEQGQEQPCIHQDAEQGTPQWLRGTLWTHECVRCGVVEPLHPTSKES